MRESPVPAAPQSEWALLARQKLARVLGVVKADAQMKRTLAQLHLTDVADANALHRFAMALSKEPGFAGAVGGLLAVEAIMRGARGAAND